MEQSSDRFDLRAWREARGLTLSAAAEFFGFGGANPAETYRRYEAGLVWPPAETIDLIVKATEGRVTVEGMLRARLEAKSREAA